MLRTLIPAISAASIQLSFFAIAFRITSCSFIIRSASRAGIVPLGVSTSPVSYPPGLDRTTHLLIRPDNSHTSDSCSSRGQLSGQYFDRLNFPHWGLDVRTDPFTRKNPGY